MHCNHPNELDETVREKMQQLQQAGGIALNQSVLLKGINDSAETLSRLSQSLFTCGILPYYLHLLDKVQGAAHFDVSQSQAVLIMQQLTQQLPGYLVPKLVKEEAGKPNKTLIQHDEHSNFFD